MKRPLVIQAEYEQTGTIKNLTSVFEAIASLHIAQIKDKVTSSTVFFSELWQVYTLLRSEQRGKIRRTITHDRPAVVAITSEGGLIGDIDERIVAATLAHPDLARVDLYMIGGHGSTLMAQHRVKPLKVFGLPDIEKGEDVGSLVELVSGYETVTVYYQKYVSLRRQEVARIDLSSAVQALGEGSVPTGEVISAETYVFEPSAKEIIGYLESVMLQIAMGQVLLESKRAQYASRFNAMYAAKSRATEMQSDLALELSRAKRGVGDERTKEILSVMTKMKGQA